MTGIVTQNFRINNATNFYNVFQDNSVPIYLFIARSFPWPNDNSPPTPTDTVEERKHTFDNILGVKRIGASDVVFGAPNTPWASGTVYAMYTSNTAYQGTDTAPANFYVVTDDLNVYKCLNNNNGAPSTINPSGTLTQSFTTADGYQWKYMLSVNTADALKFLTSNYIPVRTLTVDDGSPQWDVQQAAVVGAIETIIPVATGTGYLTNSGTLVSATTSTAVLGITATSTSGSYVNYGIYLTAGTGSGQLRKITSYNGSTRTVTVDSNWTTTPDATTSYIVSPYVSITGDGTGAKAYSTVNSGHLNKINMVSIGANYTYAMASVLANTSNGSGGTLKPEMSPTRGHGSDPVSELMAHNVILNCNLQGSESNTFTTQNDWRQIGLIANPTLASNGALATGSLYKMTTNVQITSSTGTFVRDEVVTGSTSGAYAYVVENVSGGGSINVTGVIGQFANSETITGGTSAATATVSGVTSPPLARNYGKILYTENKTPVTRSLDQQESFRITIKF